MLVRYHAASLARYRSASLAEYHIMQGWCSHTEKVIDSAASLPSYNAVTLGRYHSACRAGTMQPPRQGSIQLLCKVSVPVPACGCYGIFCARRLYIFVLQLCPASWLCYWCGEPILCLCTLSSA